jgi:hypothetical protein
MSETDDTVVHAYGLVTPVAGLRMPQGIDGAPVMLVQVGGVAALASELSAEAYGPEVWRAHGQEPRWLEHVASQHHAVLQAMVDQTDVLPLRLPGIYDDVSRLAHVLRELRSTFEEALNRVKGHVELGAKVFLVDSAPAGPPEQRPTSGRDYLARRSAEAGEREQARARRQRSVLDAHEAMAHAATHATVNPPQDAALSGRSEPMLLNGAYLVSRDHLEDFLSLADRIHEDLAADGLTLEVTGPWPPYNFASVGEETRVGDG